MAHFCERGFTVLGRFNDRAQLGRTVHDVSQKAGELAYLDRCGFDLHPFIHASGFAFNGSSLFCVLGDVSGWVVSMEGGPRQ
jgi:hypothetical protein